jgi:hypothetical protein
MSFVAAIAAWRGKRKTARACEKPDRSQDALELDQRFSLKTTERDTRSDPRSQDSIAPFVDVVVLLREKRSYCAAATSASRTSAAALSCRSEMPKYSQKTPPQGREVRGQSANRRR